MPIAQTVQSRWIPPRAADRIGGLAEIPQPRDSSLRSLAGESPVMYESVRAKKMVQMETFPTLADTCAATYVDLDSIALPLCHRYVEEILLLTEKEIGESIRLLFEQHRLVVEGSGALGVGGLLKHKERFKGKKVVAVVCGRRAIEGQ